MFVIALIVNKLIKLAISFNSFDNVCDNITEVEEVLKLENINEDQKYAVVFNKAKGEKHCSSTAKRLKRLPQKLMDKNVDGTVHTESCMEAEKIMSATLNLNGLKWVRPSSTNHYDVDVFNSYNQAINSY